jgi:sarcosine oxidase subunit beta
MQVCIIGAGVIGCAVALELRRRGFDVTVIDKNGDAGHGSTASSCGIVRRYYSQPGMIAMAHEGAHIWDDWSSFIGPIDDDLIVFERPGMIFIPPQLDDEVRRTVAAMQEVGVDVTIYTAEEARARFPFLDLSGFFPPTPVDDPTFFEASERQLDGVVFEADGGYVVFPALAAQNLRRAAARDGVAFRFGQTVTAIRGGDDTRFVVETAGGDALAVDVVVNVGGPHSSIINDLAGVKLPLETRALRREVHALANPLAQDSGDRTLPIVGDLDGGIYFRPESGGRDIIVGSTDPQCDPLDFVDDPDDFERDITQPYRERQVMRLMKRFPDVTMGRPRGVADLYDVTVRDWYPIVDRTELPGYYVCIGTSGSSFKTAPVLGMLTAQIVEACESGRDTDETPLQLELPRIGRTIDTRFLSRHREQIESSATVIG